MIIMANSIEQPEHEDYNDLMEEIQSMIDKGSFSLTATRAAKYLVRAWELGLCTIGSVQQP